MAFGTVYVGNEKSRSSANILMIFLIANALAIPCVTTFWVVSPSFFGNYSGFQWNWVYANQGDPNQMDNWQSFNLHPFAMSLAFGMFSTLAIPAYFLLQWSNVYVTAFHIVNQVLACGLSIFGVFVALMMVHYNYRQHLVTVHSWLGLLAVLFYCAQIVFGTMFVLGIKCFCFDTAKHVREDTLHIHKYLGICFYITAVAALVTGIQERQSLNEIINSQTPNIAFERFVTYLLIFLIASASLLILYILLYFRAEQRKRINMTM